MYILTLDDKAFDLSKMPDELEEDVRFSVLDNNDPANLIPLCPTHHSYVHSRYKDEIQPIIDKFVEEYKLRLG